VQPFLFLTPCCAEVADDLNPHELHGDNDGEVALSRSHLSIGRHQHFWIFRLNIELLDIQPKNQEVDVEADDAVAPGPSSHTSANPLILGTSAPLSIVAGSSWGTLIFSPRYMMNHT
jgi:hypothetical protein